MGVYLSIVSGAIKLFNYMAAALQKHHDEMNGAAKQRDSDQHAREEVIKDVSAPMPQSDVDKLWSDNASKFGPNNGTVG